MRAAQGKTGRWDAVMRRRMRFLAFSLTLLLCLPAGKAFYLQIYKRDALKERATRQSRVVERVTPRRGAIMDQNGQPLAISVPVPSIYAIRENVENKASAARKLAPILEMKPNLLKSRLENGRGFVWLGRRVTPDVAEAVRKLGVKGVDIKTESRRFYPNGDLAGSVLGFVGTDGGLEGLESSLDEQLRGGKGLRVLNLDAHGKIMTSAKPWKTYPAPGATVQLTLDRNIQFFAEQSLKEGCERARARTGAAIILESNTGKILAMASYPGYNPNDFSRYDQRFFRNRGVTSVYEPGSTFKVVTISAALEEHVFDTKDIFFCNNGSFRVADVIINDHVPYGWLTLMGIIRKSSNIGASKVGLKLGRARLEKYVKRYGFGQKTGVLLPGEGKGIVRPESSWTDVDLANISFGQGVGVTPLQMVDAANTLAIGGQLIRPYLVSRITGPTGEIILQKRPEIIRRVVSEETARKVVRMMETVVEPGGSGTRAAIEGFRVAGKTGTAQKFDLAKGAYSKHSFTASFVGFAPSRNPAVTAIVVVDEPQTDIYGGVVAAPIWSDMVGKTLKYLHVPNLKQEPTPEREPEDGRKWASGTKKSGSRDVAVMPDLKGLTLREALTRLGHSNARIKVSGSGVVESQDPRAGNRIEDRISLKLSPRTAG